MIDLSSFRKELSNHRKWLEQNRGALQEAAKKSVDKASETTPASSSTGSKGGADSPVKAQLAQLKGMLQMLPDNHPQKPMLVAQIAQLEQWAATMGPASGGFSAMGNPYASFGGGFNPMQAMMMQWLQGMMGFGQRPY